MKHYTDVQNILIDGEKYSVCEVWYAFKDNDYVWKHGGRAVCKGWHKDGETIFENWYLELLGKNK